MAVVLALRCCASNETQGVVGCSMRWGGGGGSEGGGGWGVGGDGEGVGVGHWEELVVTGFGIYQ